MFDAQKEAIDTLWSSPELNAVEDDICEMCVKRIDKYSAFSYDKERNVVIHDSGNGFKVEEKDVSRLIECFGKCVDGVKSIDGMIQELTFIRGRLFEDALRLRHAYRPADCRVSIMRLHEMASSKGKFEMPELRDTLAKVLGLEKLPDEVVGIKLREDKESDCVFVSFGVKGKPTTIVIGLSVEVDYRRRYDIPDDEDKLGRIGVECLESIRPRIMLGVFLGAASESGEDFVNTTDCVESVCPDLKTLSERVVRAIGIDVRDKIRKITSIRDVKTMEDFVHWRGLRAANSSAARNDKEQA